MVLGGASRPLVAPGAPSLVVAAAPGGGAERAVPAGWEDVISMSEDA